MNLILLVITSCVTDLPHFTVMLGFYYICISTVITGFDAGKRRLPYVFFCYLPLVLCACALGASGWEEWVACLTLTLPWLQSFGIIPFTTTNMGVGLVCALFTVEAATLYAVRLRLESLALVYGVSMLTIICSIVAVTVPSTALNIAYNPLFLFLQAQGALAMWKTRDKPEISISRQHTIGACVSLYISFAFFFAVLWFSGSVGGAVLHVGDTYKQTFSSLQNYISFLYPFVLSLSVDGEGEIESSHVLVTKMVSVLLFLDKLFVHCVTVGPFLASFFMDLMTTDTVNAQIVRIAAFVITMLCLYVYYLLSEMVMQTLPYEICQKDVSVFYRMSSVNMQNQFSLNEIDEDFDEKGDFIESGKI